MLSFSLSWTGLEDLALTVPPHLGWLSRKHHASSQQPAAVVVANHSFLFSFAALCIGVLTSNRVANYLPALVGTVLGGLIALLVFAVGSLFLLEKMV